MKKYTFLLVSMFMVMIVFVACDNDKMSVGSNNQMDVASLNSAEEIQQYFEEFNYPKNPEDYQRQFYDGIPRTQLTADQITAYEQVLNNQIEELYQTLVNPAETGLAKTSTITSDYYFYVNTYKPWDDNDFQLAYQIWGPMLDWESENIAQSVMALMRPTPVVSGNWNTNTEYMDYTADVIECRNFLLTYAANSGISALMPSTSAYPPAGTGGGDGEPVLLGGGTTMLAKTNGVEGILTVLPGYVYSNLNPDFETWGAYPYAWNISINAPYNIPADWNLYYASDDVMPWTYDASYGLSTRLYLNRNTGRNLASAYFELPAEHQEQGLWSAGISFGGNDQDIMMVLVVTWFDFADQIILTEARQILTDGPFVDQSMVDVMVSEKPKYVRFDLFQEGGQTRNYVYVDNLWLRSPVGDVSLPVILADDISATFNGVNYVFCEWETCSEIDNAGFKLFYRDASNQITLVSNDFVPGLGNDPYGQPYSHNFYMLTAAYQYMVSQGDLYVFLGAQSYGGAWEYYENQGDMVGW